MKLPKIPIDRSKINSREAPFDEDEYLLHECCGGIVSGSFDPCGGPGGEDGWLDVNGYFCEIDQFSHYTPMPEFYETKGGDK